MKQSIMRSDGVILSVVIPVYNAAEYLKVSIESLFKQGFFPGELQIICIDDGSTDNSVEIIKEIQKKHSQTCIELLKQKNAGCAAARNIGMPQIKGKYFCFLDADDAFFPGYLRRICMEMDAQRCTLAQYNFSRTYSARMRKERNPRITSYIGKMTLIGNVWIYIFQTEMFGNLRYDESLKFAEDTYFSQLAFLQGPKCLRIDNEVYFYRNNPQSLINNRNGNVVAESMLRLADHHERLLREKAFVGKEKNSMIWRDRAAALYIYWRLKAGNKEEPFTRLKRLGYWPYKREWKAIIPHNFSKVEIRRCIAALLVALVGYRPIWKIFSETQLLRIRK